LFLEELSRMKSAERLIETACACRTPRRWLGAVLGLAAVCAVLCALRVPAIEPHGNQFVGFTEFSSFQTSPGDRPGERVLTSPEVDAQISWDELIVSWNAEMSATAYLEVRARAIYPGQKSRYYTMGLYSGDPARHPRESVPDQKDSEGRVSTDTLILARPCEGVQIQLTLGGEALPKLKFLGLSLIDSREQPLSLPANRAAWGKSVAVPERSQMVYSNGNVLCSPTTVSMILSYWAGRLNRPDLEHDVPEVVQGVYDPVWKGTGNWAFNMAYAGSFRGLRAYVARLSSLSELEDWVESGLPVGLSVCHNQLFAKPGPLDGHLVVCVGFTPDGDAIINDPGTRKNVRKIIPRADLAAAWARSRNTVYLVYPEDAKVPADRFGHWDSPVARGRIRLRELH
jgi:Peptidase_C39 like family